MSTTEEAQSTPAEPSAAEVQAPVEEKMEVTSTSTSTEAVTEPAPVASQPPTTESEPTKKDATQSENVKTDNQTESSQIKVKPPVPKTIQTDRPLINPMKPKTVEQMEEAKLKAKFGGLHKPGGSQFLQQRLNKGMKYFDSGDYNMAKQSGKLKMRSKGGKPEIQPAPKPTGEAIPTPASIPHRKPSSEISKLAV